MEEALDMVKDAIAGHLEILEEDRGKQYETLEEMEEAFERFEIYEMVRERMKHYDPSQNVTLEEIRAKKKCRGTELNR